PIANVRTRFNSTTWSSTASDTSVRPGRMRHRLPPCSRWRGGSDSGRTSRWAEAGIPALSDRAAQRPDKLPPSGVALLLSIQDRSKPAFLERKHIDALLRQVEPCRIADDIDQTVERVQAPEQVVILPVGARQERRKMSETNPLETLDRIIALQRARIP